jgi:hypothetical protein
MRFIAQKQWAEAEQKLAAAWALNPSYDVAANLGQVQYRLGKHREAAQRLAYAVKNWPLVGKKETRELAEKRLTELRAILASLTLQVSPAGALVSVDGVAVGRSPLDVEVFVDPGSHTVEAKLDGYDDAKTSVTAEKGSKPPVTLTLTRTAPPPQGGTTAPPAPPATPTPRSVVPGAVLGGVAGAALATGIGVLVVGAAKLSTSQSLSQQISQAHHSCVAGAPNLDAQCSTLASTSSTSDLLNRAGVGVLIGAGAAAVGSALYFLWPQPATPAVKGRLFVLPSVTATGGGVLLTGAL